MPSTAELLCVPPEMVSKVWPLVEKLVKTATDKCGSWSIGPIRGEVLRGEQLLWITWNGKSIQAVATTRLQVEEDCLVCQVIACAGSDDDWQNRIRPIEEYAKQEGCGSIRIQGRPGWSRIFKNYKLEWISLEKRLI